MDLRLSLGRFQHRQDFSRRVFKPRDGWSISTGDAAGVGLQVGFVVDFKTNAALAQIVDSSFHAVYGKIQNREGSPLVIGLGVP